MFGLASRQFDVVLGGAGVTKGGNRRDRTAEKVKMKMKEGEKENFKEPAKDGPLSPKRQGGRRRKEGDTRARGEPLICSSNPPAQGHAGPTTLVAASTLYPVPAA